MSLLHLGSAYKYTVKNWFIVTFMTLLANSEGSHHRLHTFFNSGFSCFFLLTSASQLLMRQMLIAVAIYMNLLPLTG